MHKNQRARFNTINFDLIPTILSESKSFLAPQQFLAEIVRGYQHNDGAPNRSAELALARGQF
jgi:hypothetical protein